MQKRTRFDKVISLSGLQVRGFSEFKLFNLSNHISTQIDCQYYKLSFFAVSFFLLYTFIFYFLSSSWLKRPFCSLLLPLLLLP
jgi:hypothetical protein